MSYWIQFDPNRAPKPEPEKPEQPSLHDRLQQQLPPWVAKALMVLAVAFVVVVGLAECQARRQENEAFVRAFCDFNARMLVEKYRYSPMLVDSWTCEEVKKRSDEASERFGY